MESLAITTSSSNESNSIRNYVLSTNFYNLMILSLGFMFTFLAFSTCQNYLTTIYEKNGFISLSIFYIVFSVSTLITPVLVDLTLNADKWCAVVSSFGYSAFAFACVYGHIPAVLFTVSGITGFTAALAWTAEGVILTRIAGVNNMGIYSGIFLCIFQLNITIGSLISGVMVTMKLSNWWFFFILFLISFIGDFLLLFLRGRSSAVTEGSIQSAYSSITVAPKRKSVFRSFYKGIKAMVRTFFSPKMLLLIPVFIVSGYSQSFYYGSIPPEIGKNAIGWSMTFFGAMECVGSLFFGVLSDIVGRRPCMISAFLIQATALCFTFIMHMERIYTYCLVTSVCGLADAAMNAVVYNMLCYYFNDKAPAAFGLFNMFQSLAVAGGFFSGVYLSFRWIRIVLTCLLAVACVSFFCLDIFVESVDPKQELQEEGVEENVEEEEDSLSIR